MKKFVYLHLFVKHILIFSAYPAMWKYRLLRLTTSDKGSRGGGGCEIGKIYFPLGIFEHLPLLELLLDVIVQQNNARFWNSHGSVYMLSMGLQERGNHMDLVVVSKVSPQPLNSTKVSHLHVGRLKQQLSVVRGAWFITCGACIYRKSTKFHS